MADNTEKSSLRQTAEIFMSQGVEFLAIGRQAEVLFRIRRSKDRDSLFQFAAIKQLREKHQSGGAP